MPQLTDIIIRSQELSRACVGSTCPAMPLANVLPRPWAHERVITVFVADREVVLVVRCPLDLGDAWPQLFLSGTSRSFLTGTSCHGVINCCSTARRRGLKYAWFSMRVLMFGVTNYVWYSRFPTTQYSALIYF